MKDPIDDNLKIRRLREEIESIDLIEYAPRRKETTKKEELSDGELYGAVVTDYFQTLEHNLLSQRNLAIKLSAEKEDTE